MEKKFNTSAQKTLTLSKDAILRKLEEEMSKEEDMKFEATKNEDIKAATLKDGSKLVIAAFKKENGKTLAMIDHENLPEVNERANIQKGLKEKLNKIFEDR